MISDEIELEKAFGTATRYFNSKVHVSNQEERIMAMLLMGLSFDDVYKHIHNNSIDGLPKDISVRSLNQFQHKYGTSPDVL
jgi:hypothetical protein